MTLTKKIIGFYPYNLPIDEYIRLKPELLSTVVYADAQFKSDGNLVPRGTWPPTNLINWCRINGIKIELSVGSSNSTIEDTILASPILQSKLANNILILVKNNGFDGLVLDIEGIKTTNSVNGQLNKGLLTTLVKTISSTIKSSNSIYTVSICIPAKDWNNVFDVVSMTPSINYFMDMAYDIYGYDTSPKAGPTAPLDSDYPNDPNDNSVRKSVTSWLSLIPKTKFILGVPYYGYDWKTADCTRKSQTLATGNDIWYNKMVDGVGSYGTNNSGRIWDSTWVCPRYCYKDSTGVWHQRHYDDICSLTAKYDLAKQKDIAGISIWALGGDDGRTELWDLLRSEFIQ